MTVDVAALRRKVGASAVTPDADLQSFLDSSSALLMEYVGDVVIPDPILDRAHLLVAVEMYHQDEAPNGVVNQQYDAGDGGVGSVPIRITRDPLSPAYPLLGMYMIPAVG